MRKIKCLSLIPVVLFMISNRAVACDSPSGTFLFIGSQSAKKTFLVAEFPPSMGDDGPYGFTWALETMRLKEVGWEPTSLKFNKVYGLSEGLSVAAQKLKKGDFKGFNASELELKGNSIVLSDGNSLKLKLENQSESSGSYNLHYSPKNGKDKLVSSKIMDSSLSATEMTSLDSAHVTGETLVIVFQRCGDFAYYTLPLANLPQ